MEMPETLVPFQNQRYQCRMCGECCHKRRVPLTAHDIERLQGYRDPQEFIVIFGEKRFVVEKRVWDDGCVFLYDGKCTIQKDKPLICRLFPVALSQTPLSEGSIAFELADRSRVYLYIDVSCPGVGEGPQLETQPLLDLCLAVRNEMLVTDLSEVLKVIR
jgi:Fe-S-cluster containining protein